jgi:hypothetical protein|tara:strand:- start:2339 stop:2596 length:258 start_codon:yes stop_codon:yes gene_type:complete
MASIDDVIRLLEAAKVHDQKSTPKTKSKPSRTTTKPKRKASAYSKKYAKAFKSIAPKHKKKAGGWKTGGYKRAVKQAHAKAKRMK